MRGNIGTYVLYGALILGFIAIVVVGVKADSGAAEIVDETLPPTISKFRDGNVTCYVQRSGYAGGLSCLELKESK